MLSSSDTDLLVTYFLEGSDLSKAAASRLENELKQHPEHLHIVVKLLGFYETRHLKSKKYGARRKRLIRWIFENYPQHPFLSRSLPIVVKSHDQKFFDETIELWLLQVKDNVQTAQLLINAANHLMFHDRELSKQFLQRAKELEPSNTDVERVSKRLRLI